MKYIIKLLFFFSFQGILHAQETQKVVLVGYIYESNNRGYLNGVKVIITSENKEYKFEATTNQQGKFEVKIPITGGVYNIEAQKTAFMKNFTKISTKGRKDNEGIFSKVEMTRLPGYILDMSFTDFVNKNDPGAPSYGIENAHIEIYNNTIQEEVLNVAAHPSHMIQCLLEQGNEYVFLIRKKGYYTKRMRANVNVNGCILCMEGFGTVTPSVTDNLTKENTMGMLGANVTLKKLVLNETMKMDHIYYDLGRANLRPETHQPLERLAHMMLDNPQIIIELSSHTDCRGSNKANLDLSQKRANNVVSYIQSRVKLKKNRIEAKGYGENRLINSCADGVTCTEELHQQNRRTELTVIDILIEDSEHVRTLASMMQERNFDLILDANADTYADGTVKTEVYHRTTPSMPQNMTINYTGYKIQMMDKKGDLSTDHFMFYEFDYVFLDLIEEQHYAFLIGDFKDYNTAKESLSKYRKQYPKAKIVSYKEGVRVK